MKGLKTLIAALTIAANALVGVYAKIEKAVISFYSGYCASGVERFIEAADAFQVKYLKKGQLIVRS